MPSTECPITRLAEHLARRATAQRNIDRAASLLALVTQRVRWRRRMNAPRRHDRCQTTARPTAPTVAPIRRRTRHETRCRTGTRDPDASSPRPRSVRMEVVA